MANYDNKVEKLTKANPASMAEWFPIRDILDNIMVRNDGCFVGGYSLDGSFIYYGSVEDRNGVSDSLDSLLRTCPEESMRIQVRYEVDDRVGTIIDDYVDARRTQNEAALLLDTERERIWRERAARHDFLTRRVSIYFIWDPEVYRKAMLAAGTPMGGSSGRNKSITPSVNGCIRRERQEHEELLMHFEAMMGGIQSSMQAASLKCVRLTHDDLFNELQDSVGPYCPIRTKLRYRSAAALKPLESGGLNVNNRPQPTREISVREQMANVTLNDVTETHIDIDRVLWGVVTIKDPPDRTYPGVLRGLLTLGFPLIISTNIDIPNQTQVLKVYQRREKKMISAQSDLRGRARVDATARQTQIELQEIQQRILQSSTKACHASVSIAYRTSSQYVGDAGYEAASRELLDRRQQIMHVISRMDGAAALPESLSQLRMFLNTLPGLATKDKRDHDLLTSNAADLMPIEMPWGGTPRTPAMLFTTPYRQLIGYSPFDESHANANAIICAESGGGKSMLVQQMLLTMGRQNVNVSILERGDSYYHTVKYMGGEMITMSLDSDVTINPFDLEPGQVDPSRDHLAFLGSLVLHMVGDKPVLDEDIQKSVIDYSIERAYELAKNRTDSAHKRIPLMSDVQQILERYIDQDNNKNVEQEAHIAALKLKSWVNDGQYARLFDRYTTVNMKLPWIYFNIEKLKVDPKLETAMSLLIAYTTTLRASGGKRCITVLDECWSMLESPSLSDMVIQLFRTARKRDACVWALSQAVEDFTGTPEEPKKIGGPMLMTTTLRLIGRQKGNMNVLSKFLHLSPAAIEKIKGMAATEKGKKSEFLICIGENSETTHSLYIQLSPVEYWLATSFPRERKYREWWLLRNSHTTLHHAIHQLAQRFPQGLASLTDLPEERSGEIERDLEKAARAAKAA